MGSDHAVPEVPSAANSRTASSHTPAALCAPAARSLLAQGAWLNHNEEAWSRRPGAGGLEQHFTLHLSSIRLGLVLSLRLAPLAFSDTCASPRAE